MALFFFFIFIIIVFFIFSVIIISAVVYARPFSIPYSTFITLVVACADPLRRETPLPISLIEIRERLHLPGDDYYYLTVSGHGCLDSLI